MFEVPDLDPLALPLFRAWKQEYGEGNTLSLRNYQSQFGTIDLAVAFCGVLWPTISVVDGCYVRTSGANFPHHPAMTLAEQQAYESVCNHLHIYDVFPNTHDDTPLEAYEYIAKFVLRSWRAALNEQYPDVQFEFDYQTEPDAYGPTISFWHV